MTFYSNQTTIGLILAAIPAIMGSYFWFVRDKQKLALILLLLTGILLRFLLISVDPFLHEWDERYHALVAKNMVQDPFRPMLFHKHIMSYNPVEWAYTHIWVHKQPVFLWQMAAAMKVLGATTFVLRLPSAICGVLMIYLIYDIGRIWFNNKSIGFIGAFIATFSYYALELTSGYLSLDHNDLIFTFYTTCAFWGLCKYTEGKKEVLWIFLIGVFAGLAILNKWLVGLLVFGGWGLYILTSKHRLLPKKYIHLLISLTIACIVFIPWQLYIIMEFPLESSIAFDYNRKHMTDALGHPGSSLFHLTFLPTAYHNVLLLLFIFGVFGIIKSKSVNRNITYAFYGMVVVIFAFFSLLVATKMPAFVYPVSGILILTMAYGSYFIAEKAFGYLQLQTLHRKQLLMGLVIILGFISLKPGLIIKARSSDDNFRNNKIFNSNIYKSLNDTIIENYVILNTRPYENIELMFYKDALAYHWYPSEKTLDSLQVIGYKFAAFQFENDQQQLPPYIINDSSVLILNQKLK